MQDYGGLATSRNGGASGGPAAALSKSARKRQVEARRAKRQLAGTTWLPSAAAGDRLRDGGGGVRSVVGHTAALALSGALPSAHASGGVGLLAAWRRPCRPRKRASLRR